MVQKVNNYEKLLVSHGGGDSQYHHQGTHSSVLVLSIAVFLTLGYAIVEVVGGFFSNSLALLSDAGHMVTDSASLLFALLANKLAKKPASARYSYGLAKIEIIAAFFNAIVMFTVVGWIFYEAVQRFQAPQPVKGLSVLTIASVGLIINILVAFTLSKDRQNLNTQAALLHVMGDLLGSLAAILAGLIIYFGGPSIVDPILSIFVCVLILNSSYGVLKSSLRTLLDAVPEGIPYEEVGKSLEKLEHVKAVHDLHIWDMTQNEIALSAHLILSDINDWPIVLEQARRVLKAKYGISHITLQPEQSP